jgi:hypothetical protein
LPNDRLATVKDEAGVSQGLILDHANGQRVAMTGSAVTSAGLNSPLGWVKNLGPGTVYLRGDGTAAGIDQAGSYVLYAGQDWALAADNGARTISLAGPSGTTVSLIPAKATSATVVGGVGGAGFTDADVDLMLPPRPGVPDVGLLRPILKKVRAALDATFGTIPWGAITGSPAAQPDLMALFATKSDVGHTHSIGAISGAGTAASRNVPAAGAAASNEAVLGNDPRMTDAREPTTHQHAEAQVTSLVTHLGILAVDPVSFRIPSVAVGTYVLEEYAEAAGTIVRLTDRLVTGASVTYKIQVAGVDVGSLGARSPSATQGQVNASSPQGYAVGQRTTLVVTAVGTAGELNGTLKRTRTLP